MMTPALEQKAQQLLAKVQAMSGTPNKYEHGIGHYWNFCDEVEEFLTELLDRKSADSKPMAAGHNNPLYDTEITI